MTLVQMEDPRGDAGCAQRAHAADAEDQFLVEAMAPVARVQTVGDLAGGGRVAGDVGVEQEQGGGAHHLLPDADSDTLAGDVDVDHVAGVEGTDVGRVDGLVTLVLPTADDLLTEEPLAVQQAHAHQGELQVARRLQMIAGQDAETARVLGHLRRPHRTPGRSRRWSARRRRPRSQRVRSTRCVDLGGMLGEETLHSRRIRFRNRAERMDIGIGSGERVEQPPSWAVPGPPQVRRELLERAGGAGLSGVGMKIVHDAPRV